MTVGFLHNKVKLTLSPLLQINILEEITGEYTNILFLFTLWPTNFSTTGGSCLQQLYTMVFKKRFSVLLFPLYLLIEILL